MPTATRRSEPIQIIDGKWYALAHGNPPFLEECCDCGLTHKALYAINNGRIWVRWTVDRRATRAARKQRGIKMPRAR